MSKPELDMFTWGRVIAIHNIGEYRIIEHLERAHEGSSLTTEVSDVHCFHVDGINISSYSLDEALVSAISYKYTGPNSQAGYFFLKMLGIDELDNGE
jgi:hypothetical protein